MSFVIDGVCQVFLLSASLLHENFLITLVIFTLIVRLLLLPVVKYEESQFLRMKALLETLQAQFNDPVLKQDKETWLLKMAETYHTSGVHPIRGSVLPNAVQLLVLYLLIQTIHLTTPLNEFPLLWTTLGDTDGYGIFPLLFLLLAVVAVRTSTPRPQNKLLARSKLLLPIVKTGMSFFLPTAIIVYWMVSACFTIVLNLLVTHKTKKNAA